MHLIYEKKTYIKFILYVTSVSVPNWYVHALGADWPYSGDQGTFNDGVSKLWQ